jgi:hypothetical protein
VHVSGAFDAYPASQVWLHAVLNGSVTVHVPELPSIGATSALMQGSRPHAGYWARIRGPQLSLIARFNAGGQLAHGLAALPVVPPNTPVMSLTLATFHPDTSCQKAHAPCGFPTLLVPTPNMLFMVRTLAVFHPEISALKTLAL